MDNRHQSPSANVKAFAQTGPPGGYQAGGPTMPPVPQWGAGPDRTKKMALYGVLTGIAIVLAVAVGLGASGVLRLRSASPAKGTLQATGERFDGNLLRAHGETPGPLLVAHGDKPGPLLEQSAPADVPMPADVREWLEHLRITEEKRMALANEQVGQALVLLTELQGAGASMEQLKGLLDDPTDESSSTSKKTPANTAVETAESMRGEWVKLTDFFLNKGPKTPAECVPLRNSYDQVIRETGGMMGDIIDVVNNVGDNPGGAVGKLEAMKGKSKNLIDKPALETDDGVAAICKKYHARKWFDIQGDSGGGALGKLGI